LVSCPLRASAQNWTPLPLVSVGGAIGSVSRWSSSPMRTRLRGARDTDANRGGGGVAALGPNPQCPSQLNTRPLSLLVGPRRQASPWTDSIAGARRGNRGQPLQVRGPSPTWSLRVRDSRPIKCLRQTPWLSPICTPPPDITARGSEIATTSIAH
jgi:hypothetical protein